MKALFIKKPGQAEIKQVELRKLKPNEVLIKVMACGICGTDVHIFRGEYLGDYPVTPGHEFSGIVEDVGKEVAKWKGGDRIAVEPNISCDNCSNCLQNRQNFCLSWQAIGVTLPGGMAQYVIVPEKSVFSIGDLSFEEAAFMEPLSCVLHAIKRTNISVADRVAILGAGPIGLLLLQVVQLSGAMIAVIEKQRYRAELAEEFGAQEVMINFNNLKNDFYDVVIDATGAIPVMQKTLDFVRHGGKILLFGVPPTGKKLIFEGFTIFRKGLMILSSFTSLRNSHQAVALLQSGKLNITRIISHKLPLTDFEHGIWLIERGEEKVRKVMILPNNNE